MGKADAGTRLANFRKRKDSYFADGAHSPLDPKDQADFSGLVYFPENSALALEQKLDESGPGIGERMKIAATDGQERDFIRAGRIHFEVDEEPVTLSVFKEVDRGRYFLPFRDGTAGIDTYPVGRYLDPQDRPDGTLVVDFNYAYNPYCAYSDGWSCPVPPRENVIKVRIDAGEKSYFPLDH